MRFFDPLSVISFADMFSQSVACLFFPLTLLYAEKTFLILIISLPLFIYFISGVPTQCTM